VAGLIFAKILDSKFEMAVARYTGGSGADGRDRTINQNLKRFEFVVFLENVR